MKCKLLPKLSTGDWKDFCDRFHFPAKELRRIQAIIAGAVADLEEVTATEESISSDLKNLENKRVSILRDMAVVLGHDGEQLTVTNVIEQLDGQPKEQGDLTAARDALVDVATRLQTANAQNSVLLQQALEMVEFDLTLFKSLKQAPETANYDKNAYNTVENFIRACVRLWKLCRKQAIIFIL